LKILAPNHPASPTHPVTSEHVTIVEAFLNGSTNAVVDIFSNSLSRLSRPPLDPIFDTADVKPDFDDLRTFSPQRIESVHGMFESAWHYMFDAIDTQRNPWQLDVASDGAIEAIVNDLVEKFHPKFRYQDGMAWSC
jgi:hypothetical protein